MQTVGCKHVPDNVKLSSNPTASLRSAACFEHHRHTLHTRGYRHGNHKPTEQSVSHISIGKGSSFALQRPETDLDKTAGYIWPGKGVANMIFVTYCYISSAQGIIEPVDAFGLTITFVQELSSRPT